MKCIVGCAFCLLKDFTETVFQRTASIKAKIWVEEKLRVGDTWKALLLQSTEGIPENRRNEDRRSTSSFTFSTYVFARFPRCALWSPLTRWPLKDIVSFNLCIR